MGKNKCNIKLYSTSTVWPKWQIVIPKDVRDTLWVKPGDNFIFTIHDWKYIWMVNNNDINELLEYIELIKKEDWIDISVEK